MTRITSTLHAEPDEGPALLPLSVFDVVDGGVVSVVDWVAVAVDVAVSVAVGERVVVTSVGVAVVVEGGDEVVGSAAVEVAIPVDVVDDKPAAVVGLAAGVVLSVGEVPSVPVELPQPASTIIQTRTIAESERRIDQIHSAIRY